MAKSLQASNKNSGIIGILIGIIIILGAMFVYTNIDKFIDNQNNTNTTDNSIISITTNDNNEETIEEAKYFIGQQIELTGNIMEKGDISSYTHIFKSELEESFGIKSSIIDLSSVTGNIKVSGIIDNHKGDLYIINITSIIFLNGQEDIIEAPETDEQADNNKKKDIDYVKTAGLFIHHTSGTNIEIEVDQLNERIILKEKNETNGTGKSLEISYFKCSDSSNDTNCKYLDKTFAEISSVDFTTDDGDQFYSLVDVNGRFGTVDNNFGYYLQTDDKIFLINMMQHVQFLSKGYLQNYFLNTASKLCNNGTLQIKDINSLNIETTYNKTIATINGKDIAENELECIVNIDPTLELGGTLDTIKKTQKEDFLTGEQSINLETEDILTKEIISNTTINSLLKRDDTIEQFKINLDKTYDFTARQGYTVTFPSKNIRFDSSNTKETLGIEGLYCYVKINIIKYSSNIEENKKLVEASPDTTVYLCNKNEELIDKLKDNYFVKFINSDDKKMFLIKPVNPARFDFAEGIEIK